MNTGYNAATDQNDNWRTPDWLFRALDAEFAFTLDAAADGTNTRCKVFISDIETQASAIDDETIVFCNPPYSNIDPFIEAAAMYGKTWVCILPTRTRARWFHHLTRASHVEFRWFRRRIAFDPPPGVKASSPRMDTFIAVIR